MFRQALTGALLVVSFSALPAGAQVNWVGNHSNAILLDQALPDAPNAAGTEDHSLLAVGATGIRCVKEPCPWRGITPVGKGEETGEPAWSGETLPPLDASTADARELQAAWNDQGCVVVEGDFNGETLTVARIVRDC